MLRWMSFVVGVVLTWSGIAQARCASYAETLLSREVPPGRPVIIFEIYSYEPVTDPSLVMVSTSGKAVPLKLEAVHQGMRQVQVVVVPEVPVTPGDYRLYRTTRPENASRQSHTVHVAATPDGSHAALPAARIIGLRSERQEFGCGPGETIEVALAGTAGARFAFVALADAAGNQQAGYVGLADDGSGVSVGHGMCSGEFVLETGTTYTLTLRLVGPDGALGAPATTTSKYDP